MNRAEKIKNKRLYNRILKMIVKNSCLFITFTFTNKILNNTNEKTRLRYIKKYLNDEANEYILNRDYGKKNNREHYHALIISKNEKTNFINFKNYKYGKIGARFIKANKETDNHKQSAEELAKNLFNHAKKDTTKQSKIIFSRSKKL